LREVLAAADHDFCSDRTGFETENICAISCLPQEGAVHADRAARPALLSILAAGFFRRDGRRNPAQCARLGKGPSSRAAFSRAPPDCPHKEPTIAENERGCRIAAPAAVIPVPGVRQAVEKAPLEMPTGGIRDRPASILRRRTT